MIRMVSSSKPFLIFDFDGTLANMFAFGVEIFNEVAPDYGFGKITVAKEQKL